MKWTVEFTNKAKNQKKDKPPVKVREVLYLLVREIEIAGPVRGDWPNYSKLSDTEHHCHLKKGKPSYVAVWRESNDKIRLMEVIYAGSHEKAPY